MSDVPSSAATAASKRPPSRPFLDGRHLLDGVATDAPWRAAVAAFEQRHPRRLDRQAEYRQIIATGEHLRVGADVLAGRHCPAPPIDGWLNKADGRKKRFFQYPALDELLFRVVNKMLQPAAVAAASPWCGSFLPGGGARAAFRGVLADRAVDGKAALHLDIQDYFNSIDPVDLLARLPEPFGEGPVFALLRSALLDRRVRHADRVVDGGQKGIMAGTPIAPLLATLYLRDLDYEIAAAGTTYARYSDDFLVLAAPDDLPALEHLIRARLGERGLEVNEDKTKRSAPGEAWDFLGFCYHGGAVRLAALTERKLKARTTRLARSLLRWRERTAAPAERAVGAYLRRTNLRLYGVPAEQAEFSWATWFLPVLHQPDGLGGLDEHIQREARYAATGRRTDRVRGVLPYSALVEAGHLPLVAAFWAVHQDTATYETLVSRRTGLGSGRPVTSWP